MSHLVQFQDDRSSRRFRLFFVFFGKSSDPVEHGLSRAAQEKRDAVHRDTTQVQQHGIDLHRERLAARCRAGKLVATLLTLPLGLPSSGAVFDHVITLAYGVLLHPHPSSLTCP